MERRFVVFILAAAAFMTLLLLVDCDGIVAQLALGAATAGFLWFFARRTDIDPRQIVTAIVVATIGEVVLSLGWGLYTYRHALIPLYVPPGHGLFYTLAAASARQMWFREREAIIRNAVIAFGSVYALVSLFAWNDAWGFLWWLGALALIRTSRNQLLLASCFCYTIILEWVGTAIGNWQWNPVVPGLGLHSANPPAGVGILYILLDLITVAITAQVIGIVTREKAAALSF
ncbi:MAG TPA: hypothetical protein VF381_05620 [Thermoanaerobaculia bacterium]